MIMKSTLFLEKVHLTVSSYERGVNIVSNFMNGSLCSSVDSLYIIYEFYEWSPTLALIFIIIISIVQNNEFIDSF